MQSKAKSRDKSRVNKENQIDLPGFSVFELFDQLADYYNKQLSYHNLGIQIRKQRAVDPNA